MKICLKEYFPIDCKSGINIDMFMRSISKTTFSTVRIQANHCTL